MPIHADEHLLRLHRTPLMSHQSSPAKPCSPTTTRLLILLIQALVMSVAVLLFFLFAGIATIILIHLFIAGRSIRRLRHDRYRHVSPNEVRLCKDAPRSGLSPSELKRIPISKFTTDSNYAMKLKWCSDCAVCLERFREGDRFRMMPTCNHAFHKLCADKWLVKSAVCPICRADVRGTANSTCS
ncbi:RING/U-box superfamily protein [Zostera marina]|uniref:RING-type E3 ubiquitin transferase n=1 Tax=Zostera marina TaxID=29655 RepID=A0A0K9NZG1_ZOSMR|nr:RING/U-box superfamily protein [Zostera marina]